MFRFLLFSAYTSLVHFRFVFLHHVLSLQNLLHSSVVRFVPCFQLSLQLPCEISKFLHSSSLRWSMRETTGCEASDSVTCQSLNFLSIASFPSLHSIDMNLLPSIIKPQTIIKSPYFTPEFPQVSLPDFLLSQQGEDSSDFTLSSSRPNKSTPIFYPPPSPLCDEARNRPLSHDDVRSQAYSFAAALLSGKITGSKWNRGDVLVLSSSNQVSLG